jgi:hypothetical protein
MNRDTVLRLPQHFLEIRQRVQGEDLTKSGLLTCNRIARLPASRGPKCRNWSACERRLLSAPFSSIEELLLFTLLIHLDPTSV